MKVDFAKFERSLPYASEIYGIYQPLLGWRSRVRTLEIATGISSLKRKYLQVLQVNTKPIYELPTPRGKLGETEFKVSVGERATGRSALDTVDSIVARKVGELVAKAGSGEAAWRKYSSAQALNEILADSREDMQAELEQVVTARHGEPNLAVAQTSLGDVRGVLSGILTRESRVAGALLRLGQERSPKQIAELMRSTEAPEEAPFSHLIELLTPAQSDLADATISPIGLVRLYRQYFFEFDTFLGPPVQHLWLSPGGVVELVETRGGPGNPITPIGADSAH